MSEWSFAKEKAIAAVLTVGMLGSTACGVFEDESSSPELQLRGAASAEECDVLPADIQVKVCDQAYEAAHTVVENYQKAVNGDNHFSDARIELRNDNQPAGDYAHVSYKTKDGSSHSVEFFVSEGQPDLAKLKSVTIWNYPVEGSDNLPVVVHAAHDTQASKWTIDYSDEEKGVSLYSYDGESAPSDYDEIVIAQALEHLAPSANS